MNLREFNRIVNPNGKDCYIPIRVYPNSSDKSLSCDNFLLLSQTDNSIAAGWHVTEGMVVVEVFDKTILSAIRDLRANVMVFEKPDGLFILAKSDYAKTSTNNVLACGIIANTIAYSNTKPAIIPLPLLSATCTAPIYNEITLAYHNGIGELPLWLYPAYKNSSSARRGWVEYPLKDKEDFQVYLDNARKAGVAKVHRTEILSIINSYFAQQPLSLMELNDLLQGNEASSVTKNFFDGTGGFLHHRMGEFLIEEYSIKRDEITGRLYFYDDESKIYTHNSDVLLSKMTRLVPRLKDFQKKEVYKFIDSYLVPNSVLFNDNPFSVVFKNGILDIISKKLEPMSSDHLESIMLDIDYDPKAPAVPVVDEFFRTATCGDKDNETLLYEAIGYSMLKTSELQTFFILTGSGKNGKSTYLDIVRAVLGRKNVASVSLKDLSHTFRASALDGKLASIAGDISNQPLNDSDLFKSIIGGEEVTLERKYEHDYTKSLFATLFYACNSLPRTPDTSHGFYRRFTIIPFDADLSSVTKVGGLIFKRKLLEKASLRYITRKAVEAIHALLNGSQEFTISASVVEQLKKYKIANSSVLSWLDENYRSRKTLVGQNIKTLYYVYAMWVEENGCGKVRSSRFAQELVADTGFKISDTGIITLTT